MKRNKETQPAFAEEHNFQDVSQKIEKVSQGLAGRIGVAAQEIGSGVSVTVNGDETFVMASTYKVATAVTLLDRVDKGQLKLSDLIDVSLEMMVAGAQCDRNELRSSRYKVVCSKFD